MNNQLLLTPKIQQTICPKIIQGLQILSLPVTKLNEFINDCMYENPLLELGQIVDGSHYDKALKTDSDSDIYSLRCPGSKKKNDMMERLARGEGYVGNVPESETLHGFLHLQLSLCHYSNIQKLIGEAIIGNINDDGYFVGELCEIAYHYGQNPAVAEDILEKIQTFFPSGVGARTIKECLILQVDPSLSDHGLVAGMIRDDINDLAERKMTRLSKKYGLNKERIQKILDYIRTLNPRPGMIFNQSGTTGYIIPDMVVKRQSNHFVIFVNGDYLQTVTINEHYVHMLSEPSIGCEEKNYIRDKRSEAKILIKNLKLRYITLKKLTSFLVDEQLLFFEQGPSELKPLIMKQAAEAIGVHVSTISRAVQEKYMETPWGVFPLKYFFPSTFVRQSQRKVSAIQIKSLIRQMIDREDLLNPLSDQKIMGKLHNQGIFISRRTVAKYRQAMEIDGQNKRKRFPAVNFK